MPAPAPRSRLASFAGLLLRLLLGVAIGVFLHYLLYRIFLPVEPFIYVAF